MARRKYRFGTSYSKPNAVVDLELRLKCLRSLTKPTKKDFEHLELPYPLNKTILSQLFKDAWRRRDRI